MLNHFHFLDSARDGQPRPLTFSRYAGPGSHRYPVGFSGDTVVTWASLDFQPYFTATASNIGYGWWSHDIGGHMFGGKDDELADPLGAARGLLTDPAPALGRSTRSTRRSRGVSRPRPAGGDDAVPAAAPPAAAVPAHHEPPRRARRRAAGAADVLGRTRTRREAYELPNQFLFGSELLVAPITAPPTGDSARPRSGPGCPPASGSTCSPGWSTTGAASCCCTATSRRSRCSPRPARSCRWTAARVARQRPGEPVGAGGAGRGGRRRVLRADRG